MGEWVSEYVELPVFEVSARMTETIHGTTREHASSMRTKDVMVCEYCNERSLFSDSLKHLVVP